MTLFSAKAPGADYFSVCPSCGHAESWSIWPGTHGHIMGTCHRALCSYGSRRLDQGQSAPTLPPKKKEPRYYTRSIRPLTADQEQFIAGKFGIDSNEMEGYNDFDDRFILGVYGPVGYNRRGYIAYSLSGATPKSLAYNEKPEEPLIHHTDTGACVAPRVIVEDWFSAEKVAAAGGVGVAIMGTYLDQAKVTEIAAVATGPVYLALDRDAYHKTIGYIVKYREQFPLGLYAWSLRVDLKYESTERIKAALDGESNFNV